MSEATGIMVMVTDTQPQQAPGSGSSSRHVLASASATVAEALRSRAMPATAGALAASASQQADYRSASVRMLEGAFKGFTPPMPPLTQAVQAAMGDWAAPALASASWSRSRSNPGALALAAAAGVSPGATALAQFAALEKASDFMALTALHSTAVGDLVNTVQSTLGKANLLGSLNAAAVFSQSSVGSMLASDHNTWAAAGLGGFTMATSAVQAVRMTMLRSNFERRSDSPSGALGRLDASIHLDTGLGVAVDALIASPTRSAALGFDYRSVRHRARCVDDLLHDSGSLPEVAEAVEEAQEAAGLDEDLMLDFSQTLGIPAPRSGRGPSAASILIVATVGTSMVVLDAATGHALAPSGIIATLLLGKDLWGWLCEGRKAESTAAEPAAPATASKRL